MRADLSNGWVAVVLVLALALAVRLFFFVGYQGRDDRTYIGYAAFLNSNGGLSDLNVETQWVGRVGFWVPVATSMKLLGNTAAGYAAYPLIVSLASVLVVFALGSITVGRQPALLAALFLAVMPVDVLYATRTYPDLPFGVLVTAAFWLALKSRTTASPWAPCLAGILLGLAHLHKEMAVFAFVPIGLALVGRAPQYWRQLILCGAAFAIVVLAEMGLWYQAKQDPFYRLHALEASAEEVLGRQDAILGRQAEPQGLRLLPGPRPDNITRSENSLLEAALMLTTNEEFAFFFWVGLPVVVLTSWRKNGETFDLRIWILSLLILLLFFPVHWPRYTLARDPRYFSCLIIPLLLVLSHYLFRIRPHLRWLTVAVLVSTSLAAIFLGHESSRMEPQQSLANEYRSSERLWVTPQLAADLLILEGIDDSARIGVHFIEQGPRADSFRAVQLMSSAIPVAKTPDEISEGLLVLREQNANRVPEGWTVAARLRPEPSRPVALVQWALRAAGLAEYASKLAPGGGVTVVVYRRSVTQARTHSSIRRQHFASMRPIAAGDRIRHRI